MSPEAWLWGWNLVPGAFLSGSLCLYFLVAIRWAAFLYTALALLPFWLPNKPKAMELAGCGLKPWAIYTFFSPFKLFSSGTLAQPWNLTHSHLVCASFLLDSYFHIPTDKKTLHLPRLQPMTMNAEWQAVISSCLNITHEETVNSQLMLIHWTLL